MICRGKFPPPVVFGWGYEFKKIKKCLYDYLPFIKRKKYRLQHEALQNLRRKLFRIDEILASKSSCKSLYKLRGAVSLELCLFVTYAPIKSLKPHVIDHLNALLDVGIDVVLIINSDLDEDGFFFPEGLKSRLRGIYFRENKGFDFGAWAQVSQLIPSLEVVERMLWINDSIVGPFDVALYRGIISKIRSNPADLIGLTENYFPRYHLQSFFLVFNSRLIKDERFLLFISSVLNFPDKQNVIDFYETELTSYVSDLGFSIGSIFRNTNYKDSFKDETTRTWQSLVEKGFPFIKASVLIKGKDVDDLKRLVPNRYLILAQKSE